VANTVGFTRMADGTSEEYELLRGCELDFVSRAPDRLLESLEATRHSLEGYRVNRLEHAVQSATRAARAGESEDYVVATLLHDVGDMIAPDFHGEVAAAALAPYVSDELVWIVKHHGLFQTYYYAHHQGGDRYAREQLKDHPYYEACVRFCEEYDQTSFDPDYPSEPLSYFEPMVRRVCSLERRELRYDLS
jgi:predicted HD phosphohydrolase